MPDDSETSANFAGVEIAGTTMRAVTVSSDGTVLAQRQIACQPEDLVPQIAALVSGLRELEPIKSVGVGIPGLVNREPDRVLISTGLPCELENDANAAAYVEFIAGAGRDARDIFYIRIGDSIGGAILLDGKLWTGASGCAGEIGHITINTEGSECVCGNTGCLETVASGPNIARRARERLDRDSTSSLSSLARNENFTAADLAHEATHGDDFSIMMIERTGKFIGAAVASIINLLSIERIILGGGVMEAGDLILNPIIEEARKRSFQPCFDSTKIVAAKLGADGVAIGAALLARDARGWE